jgi:hypothetical protein
MAPSHFPLWEFLLSRHNEIIIGSIVYLLIRVANQSQKYIILSDIKYIEANMVFSYSQAGQNINKTSDMLHTKLSLALVDGLKYSLHTGLLGNYVF